MDEAEEKYQREYEAALDHAVSDVPGDTPVFLEPYTGPVFRFEKSPPLSRAEREKVHQEAYESMAATDKAIAEYMEKHPELAEFIREGVRKKLQNPPNVW